MKRDYEEMLQKMVRWKGQGLDYVMRALFVYNVTYKRTLDIGLERAILKIIKARDEEENPFKKAEYEFRIIEIANNIYELDALQIYKDCVFCIFKPYTFEEIAKNNLLNRKTITFEYYNLLMEIISHNQNFNERYQEFREKSEEDKLEEEKKKFPRIYARTFSIVKIC